MVDSKPWSHSAQLSPFPQHTVEAQDCKPPIKAHVELTLLPGTMLFSLIFIQQYITVLLITACGAAIFK